MENAPMVMTLTPRRCRSFGGRSTGSLSRVRTLLTPLCLALALPAAVWGAIWGAVAVTFAATAAVTVGATIGAAKAETATEPYIRSGFWTGGAYLDDDEQFSHCVVATWYRNGVTLTVMLLDDGRWTLNLSSDGWSLGNRETYQVTLRIDSPSNRTLAERNVEAYGVGEILVIPVAPEDRLYDDLGQGRSLTVFAARETLHFGLKDMGGALQQLTDCVRRHSATAQSSKPIQSQDPAATPIAPPAENAPKATPETARQSVSKEGASKTDALPLGTAELFSMLKASGIAAPVLLPVERMMLVDRPFFQQTWTLPNDSSILGRVFHYPFSLGHPEDWLSMIGNSLMQGCRGEITSAIDSIAAREGAVVGTVVGRVLGWAAFVCDDPEVRTAFYVSGLFGREESLVFLSIGSGPGTETARSVDEALRRQIVVQGAGG